jgi:hypothetical protein
LVDFSPVGFGPVVFWLSYRLVELSFSQADLGPVHGRVDGLPLPWGLKRRWEKPDKI